jgi:hypothetical protein
MRIEPFTPEHLHQLVLQPSQAILQPQLVAPAYGEMLAKSGPAYSALDGDEVLACLGVIPQWEGRAVAWGLVGRAAGRNFRSIHRGVSRFLDTCGFRRIETAVATHFEQGHRWAQLLGFKNEGTMSGYAPDGSDYDLYARVQ